MAAVMISSLEERAVTFICRGSMGLPGLPTTWQAPGGPAPEGAEEEWFFPMGDGFYVRRPLTVAHGLPPGGGLNHSLHVNCTFQFPIKCSSLAVAFAATVNGHISWRVTALKTFPQAAPGIFNRPPRIIRRFSRDPLRRNGFQGAKQCEKG